MSLHQALLAVKSNNARNAYAPKWTIKHAQTGRYLAFARNGNHHWHDHWKHATKFTSHYQAKLFMEEHVILMCYPELVMGKSDEKVEYSKIDRENQLHTD